MKENISPEEKLLRLIRGQKKHSQPQQTSFPSASIMPPKKIMIRIHALGIRRVLIWIFTFSCIYLAFSLVYPWFGNKKISLPKPSTEKITNLIPAKNQEAVKPLEYYEREISGQRIFGNPAGAGATQPAAVNVDLLKDINLIGIISGENPQAIIEDKKSSKTYYVSKGQFIQDIEVADIQEGKIIVNYRGQRYELYL